MNDQVREVVPYGTEEGTKKAQVRRMFDRIAGTYDLLNHTLSLGTDITWRKKAIRKLDDLKPRRILDVATGTGDVAIMAARRFPEALITGIDIAEAMLGIAQRKAKKKALDGRITFAAGDSEDMDFDDNTFDAVTAAFGVRNFEDLGSGLREMLRVVRPGGRAVILEFSRPRAFPFRQIFGLYFRFVLPAIGALQSRDRKAYRYLYDSVQSFPDYERFTAELTAAGWHSPAYKSLTLGICTIYTAEKQR